MTDRETIDDLTRLRGALERIARTDIDSMGAESFSLWAKRFAASTLDSSQTPPVPLPKIVIQIQGGCLIEVCIGIPADVYLFDWDNIGGENIEWTSKRLAEWPDSFRLVPNTAISPDQSLLECLRDVNEVNDKYQAWMKDEKS